MKRIALLGAESTGKTQLAAALALRLRQQQHSVHVVDEVLRDWCAQRGRTPQADEQAAIACEQARRVEQAPAVDWVISDTTPLMVAIYSDLLFGDISLYEPALRHQRLYDLTLLTALDLPWVADGIMRDGPHVRVPVDARLRAALARAGIAYGVVYGAGSQRVEQALAAVMQPAWEGRTPETATHARAQAAWRHLCRECVDAACEYRLFAGSAALEATAPSNSPAADRPGR